MTDHFSNDTAAYALHALPLDEQESYARHLRECPSCAAEVQELTETAAHLGLAAAEPPPAELRARVLAHIARVRQLPPPSAGIHRRTVARAVPSRLLAAAASVLLVLSLGLGAAVVGQQRRIDGLTASAQRVERIVTDPNRQTVGAPATTGTGSGTAVVAGTEALVLAEDLPQLPADRAYQLWVVSPGGVRSAGVLSTRNGSATVLVAGLGPEDRLAMTVEPAGGSGAPTSDPLWRVEV